MPYEIEEPEDHFIAENIIAPFFPRLSVGVRINGREVKITKRNADNQYDIDWGIVRGDETLAVIDTEYKPKWRNGKYPYFSVARYTYAYNHGDSNYPRETVKVHYYRDYPDESFWMAIRSDYQFAGVIKGGEVINSTIGFRPQPVNFVRDIEIFEFPCEEMTFSNAYSFDIEDYILDCLDEINVL